MHDWVEKLLILQDKDLRIAKLEEQVTAAPEDKARVSGMLGDAEAAVAATKSKVQEGEKALKLLEMEVDAVRTRMRDFQSKSLMIKSNEDYRAALTQIEGCAKQISDMEDRQLVVMEDIEQARAMLGEKQKELTSARSRVQAMLSDLDVRVKNCRAQLERLEEERTSALRSVDDETAARYERLRTKPKRGRSDSPVFVPIRDDVCGRCHMNVIAQIRMNARKGVDVSCENCGALLYWDD